jgi:hypothetical protein
MANKPAEERDFEKRLPVPIYISISEDRGKWTRWEQEAFECYGRNVIKKPKVNEMTISI